MNQENTATEKSREMRKRILLGTLFVIFIVVIYFQFFSEEEGSPTPGPAIASTATTPTPRQPARPGTTPAPIVSQPLDVLSMVNKVTANAGTGRNIFVYPTPTPPPPPPPAKPMPTPPPPPVTLYSVNPSGVLARTGEFSVTVFGEKIPADAQILVDGRAYPTTVVGPTEAKAKVPAEAIQSPGNLGVQVRSQKDSSLFSNQMSINVAEPPAPSYRYIGLIITKKSTLVVIKSIEDDSIENVVKDQPFGKGPKKKWRIVNITPQKIVVEDMEIKITHTISFTGENGEKGDQ